LADWYAREEATWKSSPVLSWAIFSELMKFVTPYYQEVLDRLCDRLDQVDFTAENCRVKTLVEQLKGRLASHRTVTVVSPRAQDPESFRTKAEKGRRGQIQIL
jgi:hypothetical protein